MMGQKLYNSIHCALISRIIVSKARFEDIYVFHIYILSCFANVVLCFDTELFLNTEWCVMCFEFRV